MATVSTYRVIDDRGRIIHIDVHHDAARDPAYRTRLEGFDCTGHSPYDVILPALRLVRTIVREIVPPGALTASERIEAETSRCAEMADFAAMEERLCAEQARTRGLASFANDGVLRADALSTLAAKMCTRNILPNR